MAQSSKACAKVSVVSIGLPYFLSLHRPDKIESNPTTILYNIHNYKVIMKFACFLFILFFVVTAKDFGIHDDVSIAFSILN